MPGISLSPLDALAEELGAVAARIERELRARFDAMLAELRAEANAVRAVASEMELRAVRAERAHAELVAARIAEVRDGRDGVDGVQGPPGPPGESIRGDPGERGEDGVGIRSLVRIGDNLIVQLTDATTIDVGAIVGERGPPGVPGESIVGPVGPMGDAGPPGQSIKGDPGERGEVGPTGPPGKLPVVRAWTDGVHYQGDVVTLSGSTYQALRDTGRPPPHDDWSCLAAAGRAGSDGRSFNVCGTWSAEDVYSALDVVVLNGASFVARHDAPGTCPGEGWQMIASQGKRGQTGEKGDRGDCGPAGPAVARIEVDGDALLTITNGDGSRTTCDLYPLLIKLQS